ncbi:hypothetical protein K443DRAFT_370977 [Laccaria amethystina LaAM-08-1]|jgi:hypothetical protein|uniref:Uncharacterized protein n=1 Tax=Laccaria amethystina LaAM-08-1 TaxID=1095629 RepID=A0A0C9WRK7_9AGAR|nr:hypothetical protein K443DRAFT_370977 [Laccaria amethystina LaAM-08-1]
MWGIRKRRPIQPNEVLSSVGCLIVCDLVGCLAPNAIKRCLHTVPSVVKTDRLCSSLVLIGPVDTGKLRVQIRRKH